ncbi:MAG: hypothetical protein RL397_1444 [Pseudomonadota bacterium]|jgi:hypothetical protein
MRLETALRLRLEFLSRVVQKEAQYLQETADRLFVAPLTPDALKRISDDSLLAERLDAFVSRFGRLQDTLTDKFLPALLDAMAEPKASAIENLDRAEKLAWIDSTDEWLELRKLRNQMIHEYIEDLVVLSSALMSGQRFVSKLSSATEVFVANAKRRIEAS